VSQSDEGVARTAQAEQQARAQGSVGVAELTHGTIRDCFSEYLDGSLDATERQRIDGHLEDCRDCSTVLERTRTTVDLLGQLPRKTLPPDARAAIVRQARSDP
jgi:predicted anti-sigma-YlaC factor YlaD